MTEIILKEIEVYLQFDLLQKEYALKGIRDGLRRIKKSASESLETEGSTQK